MYKWIKKNGWHAKIQNDWKPRKKADIFLEKPTGFHILELTDRTF